MPSYKPYNPVDAKGKRTKNKTTRRDIFDYNKHEAPKKAKEARRAKKDAAAAKAATPA